MGESAIGPMNHVLILMLAQMVVLFIQDYWHKANTSLTLYILPIYYSKDYLT